MFLDGLNENIEQKAEFKAVDMDFLLRSLRSSFRINDLNNREWKMFFLSGFFLHGSRKKTGGWTENLFQIALRLMIGFYCSLHISESLDKETRAVYLSRKGISIGGFRIEVDVLFAPRSTTRRYLHHFKPFWDFPFIKKFLSLFCGKNCRIGNRLQTLLVTKWPLLGSSDHEVIFLPASRRNFEPV